ncbi:MAG: class I SAM-dependent methyltransferase [bacterium]
MQREFFHAAYQGRRAAWDVPFPQPAIVAAAAHRGFAGPVLDLGCGTGENALFLAGLGLQVTGIDLAPRAIQEARRKAEARGSSAAFRVGDALQASLPAHAFGAIIDSGFFHGLSAAERRAYWRCAVRVLAPGGRLHILGFSDPVTRRIAMQFADAPASLRPAAATPSYFLLSGQAGIAGIPATLATFTATQHGTHRRVRPDRAPRSRPAT